MVLRNRR